MFSDELNSMLARRIGLLSTQMQVIIVSTNSIAWTFAYSKGWISAYKQIIVTNIKSNNNQMSIY
jgi:hypothetical protein